MKLKKPIIGEDDIIEFVINKKRYFTIADRLNYFDSEVLSVGRSGVEEHKLYDVLPKRLKMKYKYYNDPECRFRMGNNWDGTIVDFNEVFNDLTNWKILTGSEWGLDLEDENGNANIFYKISPSYVLYTDMDNVFELLKKSDLYKICKLYLLEKSVSGSVNKKYSIGSGECGDLKIGCKEFDHNQVVEMFKFLGGTYKLIVK